MSVEYLYNLGYQRVEPGLERIQELLEKLGNPHKDFKSIHVAGTNGKGSVCQFLTTILMKAGYRTGTFTSPHLVNFGERIRINNLMIPEKELNQLIEKVKPFVNNHSFFEVVTAIAFLYFSRQKVDIAVIEVGMGGRLDATNVINPEVSIITNISIDHTKHLGITLDEIAYEKSGIIKNTPVVTTSKEIIKKDCKLHIAKPYENEIRMKGEFQKINAGLAKNTAEILGVNEIHIFEGLKEAYWPGRFDFVQKNLLFDCAHNCEGIKTLVKEMGDAVYVLGIMKDKDIKAMCGQFSELKNSKFIATKPKIERSAEPQEIAKYLDAEIIPDLSDAIKKAKEYAIAENNMVCITGSIFTVGEAFEVLGIKPFD